MPNNELPQWWHDNFGNIRVMGIIEGYVMFRRPRCSPSVLSVADFRNKFKQGKMHGGRYEAKTVQG